MRSKVAIWSLLALVVALPPGCGSSAMQGTDMMTGTPTATAPTAMAGIDAGLAVDTGTAVPAPSPPVSDGTDATAGTQPAPEAGGASVATVDARVDVLVADAPSGGSADARITTVEASTPIAADASMPPTSAFTCTLLIGIQATEEWYIAGFETMVDSTRWELMWYHSGFVELWANPNDPVWATAITSPCAQTANKPDRVIFVALNYLNDTLAFWTPNVTAAVANIQAKYPSAKRIELMTFIRAPGNVACPQAPAPRSTITPAQDQAMAMVAAANPGLVFVAPQFEAKTCSEFSSNPPHPTAAGATAWATMMANYYR